MTGGAVPVGSMFASNRVVSLSPYDENPALRDLQQAVPSAARGIDPPTLFPSGDLPPFTASGLDPSVLADLPWLGRHAVAAEPDRRAAYQMASELGGPDGPGIAATEEQYAGHPGNAEYLARMSSWAMRSPGVDPDEERSYRALYG